MQEQNYTRDTLNLANRLCTLCTSLLVSQLEWMASERDIWDFAYSGCTPALAYGQETKTTTYPEFSSSVSHFPDLLLVRLKLPQ